MQALLVTLIKLFLNYKPSAGRGEIDKRLVKDHLRGVGAPEISVNPP
jgi:hypothetical protein